MKINWNHLIAFIGALLISFLWLFTMYSCSTEHHLSKAQKHIDIAKRKGAVITPDTIWKYNYTKETIFDTITNTYKEVVTKDSTVQTINNTISAGMSRQERKALESSYKHLEKMMKLQNDSLSKQLKALVKTNKQDNKAETKQVKYKEKDSFPWWMLFLSLILFISFFIIKQFKR